LFPEFVEHVETKSKHEVESEIPNDEKFTCDNLGQVSFQNRILVELQKVNWRRVHCEYTIEGQQQQIYVHDRCINKTPRLLGKVRDPAQAVESCKLLVKMLTLDHVVAVTKMNEHV